MAALYVMGYGWVQPGRWKLGTYRMEILIDGVKFAEGSFTITGAAEMPRHAREWV
jgi:Domain of unknown function (DUF3859)